MYDSCNLSTISTVEPPWYPKSPIVLKKSVGSTAWPRMIEFVGNNAISQIWNLPSKVYFCSSINITDRTFFFKSCHVITFGQCQLRDEKHQYVSIVSLPTDSVIVDHAVVQRGMAQKGFIKLHKIYF
jgi:hypothetical protein